MAKNINYRCLVCGGELAWNPQFQKWKCGYCDSEFTLSELEAAGKGKVEEDTVEKGRAAGETEQTTDGTKRAKGAHLVEYTCSYCGAVVVTDETTSATFCAYCQSPIAISEKLSGEFAPEGLIPFKNTKQEATATYKNFIKKILTPKAFYLKDHIEKITGVYVPFFLYDAVNAGAVDIEGKRISVWTSGKKRYTKTDIFRYEVEGELSFASVPVDASSKMDNATMDSIEPFTYKEMVDFSPAYLAGFMAERYDEDADMSSGRARKRMDDTLRAQLLATSPPYDVKTVTGDRLNCQMTGERYVLMPAWILNTKYKDKDYLFAMNGQTGKFVGNAPIDWAKLILIAAAVFAGAFLLVFLIVFLIAFFNY